MPSKDQQLPDIAFHLDQLGETTTAAELVRKKGQSRKLKVISEKKLMDWILALLQQHMAGKADAFSDEEKAELVRKAQEELQKRLKLQSDLEAEKAKARAQYEQTIANLESSKKSAGDYEKAVDELKKRLEEAENVQEDLRQDNEDLHDQLAQKMALLSTTIDEKNRDREKLQHALRNQMLRSNALVEGVLALDNDYYGSKHQEGNPVNDSAGQEEQFFHDFDVGAAVVGTLSSDLERLRDITKDQEKASQDPRRNLLESDLELIQQLKDGSLAAVDVAQPVAGLVEAVEGVRAEAEALEKSGVPGSKPQQLSAVPDADGKPAEVIAGVTQVVRQLGSVIALERKRLNGLKEMADAADQQKSALEADLENLRAAHDDLVRSIAEKAKQQNITVPKKLVDAKAAPAERAAAAVAILDQFKDKAELEKLQSENQKLSEDVKQLSVRAGELDKVRQDSDRLRAQSGDLTKQLKDAKDQLFKATSERDEMVASGKEVIAQLTQQREGREKELQALRKQEQDLQARVNELAERSARIQDVNRSLTESMAEVARSPLADPEISKQIEKTLTDMPAESDVPLKPEVAKKLSESARSLAKKLIERGRTLADEQARLANAEKERAATKSELDQTRAQLAKISEQLKEAEGERSEMAAHGKEIITQLTQQRDAREKDLQAARTSEQTARNTVNSLQSKLHQSESANRHLAEALAGIAAAEAKLAPDAGDLKDIEEHRVDLEVSLSEMPGDDEHDVATPAGMAERLAAHGKKIADAIAKRRSALGTAIIQNREKVSSLKQDVEKLNQQLATVRSEVTEKDRSLTRGQAELDSLRKELKDQSAALASKASELAASKADIGHAADKIKEQEKSLKETSGRIDALSKEVDALKKQHHDASERAKAAEEAQVALSKSLRSLTTWGQDETAVRRMMSGDELKRVSEKLDSGLSKQNYEQLASAGQSMVQTIRDRLKVLANDMQHARSALDGARSTEETLRRELAQARAQSVSNESNLQNTRQELEQTKAKADAALKDTADRLNKEIAERQRLTKELDQISHDRSGIKSALDDASRKISSLEKDLQQARESEKAIGDTVANLSRELLVTAKAVVSDENPKEAGKITESIANLDRMPANKRLAAALEVMPSLREQFTNQAIDVAELRAQVASNNDALAELAKVKNELLQTSAELEEMKARGAESRVGLSKDYTQLKQDLASEQQVRAKLESDIAGLKERLESSEARVRKQKEEFSKSLDEKAKLESELADSVSRNEELRTGLEERRKELPSVRDKHAKDLALEREKTTELREELRKVKEEVVGLRARLRRLSEPG